MKIKQARGFTLIEVLLALSVIAIALTALIKSTAQTVTTTGRIKDKSISHWVAMQAVTAIQLGVLTVPDNQEITNTTTMLGQKWYWRTSLHNTTIKKVQEIKITLSKNPNGPFDDELIAFRRKP